MIGKKAPDFELPAADGSMVRLADYYARGPVVLYFYPRDDSPGCTVEACAFRDAYEDFRAAGAEVIGVSDDSAQSHQHFADKHRLPFVLVTDEGDAVAALYEVKSAAFGLLKGRETFVIDQQGIIRHQFSSAVRMQQHVKEALVTVRRLLPQRAATAQSEAVRK